MLGDNALLYDGSAFPQSVMYAQCFNMFALDMCVSLRLKELRPVRQTFVKIFVVTKDREKFKPLLDNYAAKFPIEYIDELPDYRNKSIKEVSDCLRELGFINAFDDIKAMRLKARKQALIDAENARIAEELRIQKETAKLKLEQEEKQKIFNDPAPEVPLKKNVLKPAIKRIKHA